MHCVGVKESLQMVENPRVALPVFITESSREVVYDFIINALDVKRGKLDIILLSFVINLL